ncbi:TIGR00266 family protein [Noviherbaspirillum saxi]|uniref:TIGR00266 family protein n=1 Tax=Noviherbaspirillum saxi TaxID=2320863 RepID=A0A3A3FLT5_9BURK|nr:TIGR00266 family protein [Noviherbaspirillum saxi]RJF96144.1 TIGR00266 family protein [Noviherbaspirillum saxi]
MAMDEIDYEIFGSDMQYVEVELDPGEAAVGEAGMMMFMQDGIEMDTVFGDGSQQGGLFGKLLGAGKRLLTGESLFTTVFHNEGSRKARVAFAASYPGKIVPVHLSEIGGTLICQKDSFLCAAKGVSLGIALQRKLGAGLFGGEGFIMQKLEGNGWAFVHAGGTLVEKTLAPGEVLRVDTGCVVAFQPQVDFDIKYVGKIKSAVFGGEGLFFATLRGPGKVWLQSLPLSRLANRLMMAAPASGGSSSSSLLGAGALGGLGGLMGGDDD